VPLSAARGVLLDIAERLAPRPGRFEFSTRVALICALTVLVAEIYQTPDPALTAYIVFFLNYEERAKSIIMSVVLLILITVLIGILLVVAMVVADDPVRRFVGIAVLSFALLFVASASKLRPIGGTSALIVGYGLDVLGRVQIGELATRGYLYVWLFVGIPVAVSLVVNLLLAPSPRRLAQRAIGLRLELSAAMLRGADDATRRRFEECLREGNVEIEGWLKLAKRENSSPPHDIAALQHAAGSAVAILAAIDLMQRNPEVSLPDTLRETLARTLDDMAAILASGGYPIDIVWPAGEVQPPLEPLAAQVLADIKDAIERFSDEPDPDADVAEEPTEARGFFQADALTNPEHVYYALRTTAAAMFCYVLYSLLDWSGIHTAFITCYIVGLETTAESVEKLTLRITGCLIGAAAGYAAILFLLPYLTSIGGLMVLVFAAAYASAYVVGGGPRIAYAGFQIAFAFFLCVIQGSSPAFDLSIGRDRVVGILLGNIVSYLLYTNLWPVSVGTRIDPAIAAVLQRLGTMMTAVSSSVRRSLAGEAQAALTAIRSDIDLARYEPSTVRPSDEWLATRREETCEIEALAAPLLLTAGQDAVASAHIAGRLKALAARFSGLAPERSENPRKACSVLPLFSIVDSHLQRLEAIPTQRTQ
jgi:multidrug resistance protein MdtO